jgi:S1-C subfamily serine protease
MYRLGAFGTFMLQGLRVEAVVPGSPAALQAGLEPGDVIVGINGRPVRNQTEFVGVLNNSGGHLRLLIRNVRDGELLTACVRLDQWPRVDARPSYPRRIPR